MIRHIVPWLPQIPEKNFLVLKHRHVPEVCGYVDRTR
jgi:hypothetical protein